MRASSKVRAALIGLLAVFAIGATPAQAAKLYFGTQEYLHNIQDIEAKGPKGEALYLGHKYSFHSFILPYRMTDDGYILGIRGEQSYFRLDDANIKSMQARGQLPSPLPPYQLSVLDYAMGHGAWIALAVIIGLIPLSMLAKRRRKRALPHLEDGIARHQTGDFRGAAESYGKAIEIDPKLAAAFHFRGNAYAALNDPKGCDLRVHQGHSHRAEVRCRFDEPRHPDARNRKFRRRRQRLFAGHQARQERCICVYQRGLSYLGKGDFRRAIADFTKVIAIGPEFAEVYRQRALAYSKLGDTVRALADQTTAADIANAEAAAQQA